MRVLTNGSRRLCVFQVCWTGAGFVGRSLTYLFAVLSLTQTSGGEAEKNEVDDHSHLDSLLVSLHLIVV